MTEDQQRFYDYGEGRKDQANEDEELLIALRRLERAVDLHLGRSPWTQTKTLKGYGYSEEVRKELYAAHDAARAAIAKATGCAP